MKKTLALVAQFVLFLFFDAFGSLVFHPFHIQTALSSDSLVPRTYIWDGIILMLAAYLLLILIEALRKRLARSGPFTTLAVALAALCGYLLKLGFVTHNW